MNVHPNEVSGAGHNRAPAGAERAKSAQLAVFVQESGVAEVRQGEAR